MKHDKPSKDNQLATMQSQSSFAPPFLRSQKSKLDLNVVLLPGDKYYEISKLSPAASNTAWCFHVLVLHPPQPCGKYVWSSLCSPLGKVL